MDCNYSSLAFVYDTLMRDFPYKKYAEYVMSCIKDNNLLGPILDAGCGTGTLLSMLKVLDNDLIGIDICPEMLTIAEEKNTGALLLNQDLTKIDLYGTVSCVVSTLDVINHLESLKDVSKFISNVSLFLEKEGIFIFDMNLPYKHETVLSNNSYVYEVQNSLIAWRNQIHKKKVLLTIDVFTKNESGNYTRKSNEFFEYTYGLNEILNLLKKDFTVVKILDGEGFNNLSDTSSRVFIHAIRK